VDHFTAAFLALMEAPGDGGTYHIVNPRLKPVGELIAHATDMFGLRGIEARPASALEGAPRNALESLYDGYLEAYGPYMRDKRVFGTEASGPVLSDRGLSCGIRLDLLEMHGLRGRDGLGRPGAPRGFALIAPDRAVRSLRPRRLESGRPLI
jgi:hypothetical protein